MLMVVTSVGVVGCDQQVEVEVEKDDGSGGGY